MVFLQEKKYMGSRWMRQFLNYYWKKIPKLTYFDQDGNSLSIGKLIHIFFKWSFNFLAEVSTTWTNKNIDVSKVFYWRANHHINCLYQLKTIVHPRYILVECQGWYWSESNFFHLAQPFSSFLLVTKSD